MNYGGHNSVCNIWENRFPRIVLIDLRRNPLLHICTGRKTSFPSVPSPWCGSSGPLWVQAFQRHAWPGHRLCQPASVLWASGTPLSASASPVYVATPVLRDHRGLHAAFPLCFGKIAAERTQLKGSGRVVNLSVQAFLCSFTEMEMEGSCLFFGLYGTTPACLYLEDSGRPLCGLLSLNILSH